MFITSHLCSLEEIISSIMRVKELLGSILETHITITYSEKTLIEAGFQSYSQIMRTHLLVISVKGKTQ
jgi:hypothetical protein